MREEARIGRCLRCDGRRWFLKYDRRTRAEIRVPCPDCAIPLPDVRELLQRLVRVYDDEDFQSKLDPESSELPYIVDEAEELLKSAAVPVDGEARIPDPGLTREEATSIGPGFGPITEATPCACGAIQPCHYCPVNASARAKLRASLAAADKGENDG